MKNREQLTELMTYFRDLTEGENLPAQDEEAIIAAYRKQTGRQSLPVKILSVFGGILAGSAFTGFFLISGLGRSGGLMLGVGTLFIAGAIWLNNRHDKIIIDTAAVSACIIGFVLLGMGLIELDTDESLICSVFILFSLGALRVTRSYILSFISVLILNGSLFTLLICNDAYSLMPLHTAALALTITGFMVREARIITAGKWVSAKYDPVKTGLIFSFTGTLILAGRSGIYPIPAEYIWVCSGIIIAAILRVAVTLRRILELTGRKHTILLFTFTLLVLLPTIPAPAISGALLVILLSFLQNYKTGLTLGIITFIYAVCQYYYDLNFTLLTKSILLFTTGILFIAIYLYTHKKLTPDEKA